MQDVLKRINKDGDFDIVKVDTKQRKRQPQPPFTTSTMQQTANTQLKFRTRKTMMAAQQLYEGINLGKGLGQVGLITYMRTDSTRISSVAKNAAAQFIHDTWGEEYSQHKPVQGKLQEGLKMRMRPYDHLMSIGRQSLSKIN